MYDLALSTVKSLKGVYRRRIPIVGSARDGLPRLNAMRTNSGLHSQRSQSCIMSCIRGSR